MDYSSLYFDPKLDFVESNGNLPHRFQNGKLVFVTWRQSDSMPQSWIREYLDNKETFLKLNPLPWDADTWKKYNDRFTEKFENYLNAGYGSCVLRNAFTRKIVEDALLYYDCDRIYLHAYVIMPNHVHVLMEIYDAEEGRKIVDSIKHFTTKRINAASGLKGQLWSKEPYDRIIRNDEHRIAVLNYIKANPKHLSPQQYTLAGRFL